MDPLEIKVTFQELGEDFKVQFSDITEAFTVDMSEGGRAPEIYDGPYEVTPGEEEQTLFTAQKTMAQDVVIAPIPSNYGLITYNGSTITIS